MDGGRRIVVGRVGAAHGLEGEVRVWSYCEPAAALLDYGEVEAERGREAHVLRVISGRTHGRALIVRFAGVDDRNAAARLTGAALAVRRAQLPVLPAGEYYWADLEGLTVRDLAGRELGRVHALMQTGANDVLVVRGDRERLIPYLRPQVVREVDLTEGVLRVDWDAEF